MSAQETVPGQASSTLDFISSITSNPLSEFLFGPAFFSLTMVALLSNKTDASQPCERNRNEKLKDKQKGTLEEHTQTTTSQS